MELKVKQTVKLEVEDVKRFILEGLKNEYGIEFDRIEFLVNEDYDFDQSFVGAKVTKGSE